MPPIASLTKCYQKVDHRHLQCRHARNSMERCVLAGASTHAPLQLKHKHHSKRSFHAQKQPGAAP